MSKQKVLVHSSKIFNISICFKFFYFCLSVFARFAGDVSIQGVLDQGSFDAGSGPANFWIRRLHQEVHLPRHRNHLSGELKSTRNSQVVGAKIQVENLRISGRPKMQNRKNSSKLQKITENCIY
jgi:hypothetical protein